MSEWMWFLLIIWAVMSLPTGFMAMAIGTSKGRDPWTWFMVGLLFGVIGILAVGLMERRSVELEERRLAQRPVGSESRGQRRPAQHPAGPEELGHVLERWLTPPGDAGLAERRLARWSEDVGPPTCPQCKAFVNLADKRCDQCGASLGS